jgi:hypothetical protein
MDFNLLAEVCGGWLLAILVLCIIRTLQVRIALRELLQAPNIVEINRVKRPSA